MLSDADTISVVEDQVLDQLLPQFIDAAGGDDALARAMIRDQIDRYQPRTSIDLRRVGRMIGLRMSAVDHLRLSMGMDQDIQDCWTQAVSLSNEADRIMQSLNGGRDIDGPFAA
jgi:hypothetical protein